MSKSTDKQISLIMKQMGFDPLYLTKELRKKHVQKMTLKERCEYINHMRLPFGIVRCTPHRLLKKWLGMDLLSVMNVGISFYRTSKELNFLFNSCFHISHIDKDRAIDYGFFALGRNAEYSVASEVLIDEALEEGVIDLSTFDGEYIVGLGPKTFEKFKSGFCNH